MLHREREGLSFLDLNTWEYSKRTYSKDLLDRKLLGLCICVITNRSLLITSQMIIEADVLLYSGFFPSII